MISKPSARRSALIGVATAGLFALGTTFASPASATGDDWFDRVVASAEQHKAEYLRVQTCDKLDYEKFDYESGKEAVDGGTLTWDDNWIEFEGDNTAAKVDVCIKAGRETHKVTLSDGDSFVTDKHDISHVGWMPADDDTTEPEPEPEPKPKPRPKPEPEPEPSETPTEEASETMPPAPEADDDDVVPPSVIAAGTTAASTQTVSAPVTGDSLLLPGLGLGAVLAGAGALVLARVRGQQRA